MVGKAFGKRLLRLLPGTVSAMLAVSMAAGALRWMGAPATTGDSGVRNPGEKYRMYVAGQVGSALEGIYDVERVYWIDGSDPVAPKPDANAFAEADPGELDFLPKKAAKLLDGQELFFSGQVQTSPGTRVRYYLDDTILAITWKQVLDGGTYTFSEVKIAHPSQFRRFLAGGEFGSDKLYITTQMASSVNAVVASSGDFYSYRQAGTLVYDGKVRRIHNGLVDTCYVDENGNLHFTGRDEQMDEDQAQAYVEENRIRFSLAFGPVLIREGEVVTPSGYAVGEINDCYPRSALCQLGKLHYLLAVVNAEGENQTVPTIHRFARNLCGWGITTAYALDGGQTAVIAMDGELINAVLFGYQRKISDIIYFATAIPEGG